MIKYVIMKPQIYRAIHECDSQMSAFIHVRNKAIHLSFTMIIMLLLSIYHSIPSFRTSIKGITKFWYGVMNLVQINILEAYAFLQYSLIVVPVEIESKVMKLWIINSLCCIAPSQGQEINLAMKQCFLTKIDRYSYSRLEIIYHNYIFWDFHGRSYHCTAVGAIWNLSKFSSGAPVNFYIQFFSKTEVF